MARHSGRNPTDSSSRTLEETAALLVRVTQERDSALSNLDSASSRLNEAREALDRAIIERDALAQTLAEREKVNAAALADANAKITELESAAGAGNGPETLWLTLVQAGPDDFRVLTLTTPGVPPRATLGEHCADRFEGEERFRIAAADLFEKVEREET